jgi:peptidoglycan/xylan/chitin deacetylase (PgdA/CDA1 family)
VLTDRARTLAAAAANRLHLLDAYAFLKKEYIGSQVVIAMYHRVCRKKEHWSFPEVVSPQSFQSQIEYFCQNCEIFSLDKLARDLREGKSLPKKAVVITFDDGYKDNYLNAFPILRKYRVPATFFLTTGHIGLSKLFWWDEVGYVVHNTQVTRLRLDELGSYSLKSTFDRSHASFAIAKRLNCLSEERKNDLIEKLARTCRVEIPTGLASELILSWEEVREMSRDGAQFGAHSVTHPLLTNMPLKRAEWEIRQSKEDIEKRLRKEVNFFSYPDGRFNSEIIKIVQQAGFLGATTGRPSWITPASDVYRLDRINMIEDPDRSAVLLSGLLGDVQTT